MILSAEQSFLIGNLICMIGTLLLIRTVIKNKKVLHGYDLLGAILTFIALLFLLNGFISSQQYASVGFSLVTVAYWGFIVAFKFYYGRKRKQRVTVEPLREDWFG